MMTCFILPFKGPCSRGVCFDDSGGYIALEVALNKTGHLR